MLGVPVPDATQWEQIERGADWASGVCPQLACLAAPGELISQDDTAVRSLSLIAEHRHLHAQAEALGLARSPNRTGRYTTAWVVQAGEQPIGLDDSGRSHAGATLQALWEPRQEADEAGRIRCHWLAPGRRPCSDLADVFPKEGQGVIEARNQVFEQEDEARDQQRSPTDRLTYPQALSQPMMDALTHWLQKRLDDRLGEPNSS